MRLRSSRASWKKIAVTLNSAVIGKKPRNAGCAWVGGYLCADPNLIGKYLPKPKIAALPHYQSLMGN